MNEQGLPQIRGFTLNKLFIRKLSFLYILSCWMAELTKIAHFRKTSNLKDMWKSFSKCYKSAHILQFIERYYLWKGWLLFSAYAFMKVCMSIFISSSKVYCYKYSHTRTHTNKIAFSFYDNQFSIRILIRSLNRSHLSQKDYHHLQFFSVADIGFNL